MDPLLVFDCDKHMPNRFALALAGAARARALRAGVPPRIGVTESSRAEIALREIASGVFAPEELDAFLPGRPMPRLLAGPSELGGSETLIGNAAASGAPSGHTVH